MSNILKFWIKVWCPTQWFWI